MGLDLLLRNYRVTYYSSPFNCSGVRSSSRSLPRQQKATTSWPGCRPTQALSMLQRACPWGSTHILPTYPAPFQKPSGVKRKAPAYATLLRQGYGGQEASSRQARDKMHSATHMYLPLFGDMFNSLSSRRSSA